MPDSEGLSPRAEVRGKVHGPPRGMVQSLNRAGVPRHLDTTITRSPSLSASVTPVDLPVSCS